MPSLEPGFALAETERRKLLEIARAAIAAGRDAPWLGPDLEGLPPALLAPGAAFVTLHRHGALRGCIGSLEPHRPLAEDVAGNARAAAYQDPRFPAVSREEIPELELEISVLSPLVPFPVANEAELLLALRPRVDGLVLADGHHRATFLPAVWAQLPDPRQFLAHLKHKAGLPADHWSPTIHFLRYTVEEFR